MVNLLKRGFLRLLRSGIFWKTITWLYHKFRLCYQSLEELRNATDEKIVENTQFLERQEKLIEGLKVRNGPFASMIYPSAKSVGSVLLPKILGSYERELHPIVSRIISQKYDVVVDIGCAEGYYAVGIGMHQKQAKVYAFDTDETALTLCRKMGELNGVSITVGGFCDQKTLKNLDLGRRALIISDCEGYENNLFDTAMAGYLGSHDLLIETHDQIKIESTQNILEAFGKTHDCEIVESMDDIMKAYTYDFPELSGMTLYEKLLLLSEYRPCIMRWVFAQTRQTCFPRTDN
jgi:precorrin-6B methylase 2